MSGAVNLALLLVSSVAGPPDRPIPDHAAEIRFFASTLAIAKTTRTVCAGVTINETFLEGLRQRLHMHTEDAQTFAAEGRTVVQALSHGVDEAPSRQAWCDAALRMYGPTGYMIRGLLLKP